MKSYVFLLLIIISTSSCFRTATTTHTDELSVATPQEMSNFEQSNVEFRNDINKQYASQEHSPLKQEDRVNFTELPFFELNEKYYVKARVERIEDGKVFEMPTTTDRTPVYKVFAKAYFEINDTLLSLTLYQNQDPQFSTLNEDHLFLPFKDMTNGVETYGGGRYIDLKIPTSDYIFIDFNKSYNPYCAYNDGYSCPIPPAENTLNIKILAGVKYNQKE